jgi:hypothetical protein
MSEPTDPITPLSTQLIHHDYQPPAGFGSMAVGVHKASTVIFPNVAALRARDWRSRAGYTYGLHGTPIVLGNASPRSKAAPTARSRRAASARSPR